jgi:uncharacterized membrane protein YidH (DUF202 family)
MERIMSEDQKNELKKNGFVIFSSYQFVITLFLILVSFLITVGVGMNKFATMEKQVEQNMTEIDKYYVLYQQSVGLQKETKFNLKLLMNKFKLDYVEDTDK